MKKTHLLLLFSIIIILTSCSKKEKCNRSKCTAKKEAQTNPILPSWNDNDTKKAIIEYVEDVTAKDSKNYIAIEDRIATFDNDGNLWAEQPLYFQLFFAIDRIKELAPQHPEWKTEEPYKSILNDDMESLFKQGEHALISIIMSSHGETTTEEFNEIVKEWVRTKKHPTKNVKFDKLVYQPMLELLNYLQENQFKTYIVSGGGIDFMRAIVTEIYNIPEEQILGSSLKTSFEYNNGTSSIKRLNRLEFINDKEGKPINIQKTIGKKPVFASGNSDGDLQMLQWTDSNSLKNFKLYLHHTDSIREWAYDRNSHIGKLDKGLDEANKKNWTVIDMKKDWKVIFPFELK